MKKILCLALLCILVLSSVAAYAEGFGIQPITPNVLPQGVDDMSDMQIGSSYSIDGYAKIIVKSFDVLDYFCQYEEGYAGNNSVTWSNGGQDRFSDFFTSYNDDFVLYDIKQYAFNNVICSFFNHIKWIESGTDGDFVCLRIDLNNLSTKAVNFLSEINVIVVEDENYKFQGWIVQYDENYKISRLEQASVIDSYVEGRMKNLFAASKHSDYGTTVFAALHQNDEEPIAVRYSGHYVVGCCLPTDVLNSTSELKLVITLNGEEAIYYIRK